MTRTIMYRYDSWIEGCGCCSNSPSTYDVYEDGVLVSEDNWCDLFCDEEDVRNGLKHLEPFHVDSNSRWF